MKESSFYLHSSQNRRLYPKNKYPLTHLIDYQNVKKYFSKRPTYIKHFKYTFIFLFLLILIGSIFFRVHIYLYNTLFGPFHKNLEEFLEHTEKFDHGQSWFKRIEYIQIELGENNIRNPTDSYDTIRKYSDPTTRRNHIATYKKVQKPNIYIRLPTRSQKNFHAHHPFHFSSYSIRTLQCIVNHLQTKSKITTYQTWIEKSEYIQYINEEYTKNSTAFNMLVLTKCGLLIGYLYRPMYDKAFLPTQEYTFSQKDIAFDTQRQYCSYLPLIIFSLILLWLLIKGLFYLFLYFSNIIRCKLHFKVGFFSFPITISSEIHEELYLLNIDDCSSKQLLKLDEFIKTSRHRINNQLFIIENDFQQLFVVLFYGKLYENFSYEDDSSPFIICPVTDIKKIVQYTGICYGRDSSWIPWPQTVQEDEQNYSEWLHQELMEISEYYQEQYNDRLRYEPENESQPGPNFLRATSNWNGIRRRRHQVRTNPQNESELDKLIREEKNHQRLKFERQHLYQNTTPASPQFIAKFRMEQKLNPSLIDSVMEQENFTCSICHIDLKLNDPYGKWPCPSKVPHIFHLECMLNILRTSNTCPICRHSVEAGQLTPAMILHFFRNLVF